MWTDLMWTEGGRMALVVKGRLMPLASDGHASADGAASAGRPATVDGRLWIGDDARIAAVTEGDQPGPPGFDAASTVDVGTALVLPGLIDLHNHLAYNTLPLWTEPGRTTPFPHHNSWPDASTYPARVTWPAYAFITACPDELLAYVETKAIVGGTTSIQGSPPKNRPREGWLVRDVDDETWGGKDPNLVYASTLTMTPDQLAQRAERMRAGSVFIYHCGEGQPGSIVAREFRDAAAAGCLQRRFVAVHCNSVAPPALRRWTQHGAIAWSPLSNLWLYGSTTDIPAVLEAGLTVCLGADWGPSGSKNVLGELKAARVVADHYGWPLTDEHLVRMVTCNPGDVLARAWGRQTGRLQPDAIADVTVIASTDGADPFHRVVTATEHDVRLVIVDGQARYGTPELMRAAGATTVTSITVNGHRRALSLSHPADPATVWPWQAVLDRLEAVRADPKGEIERGEQRLAGWSGLAADRSAPLVLGLDMPTGPVRADVSARLGVATPAGALPKDLTQIVIPPLDALITDAAFLESLVGHGFHGGILNRLTDFYS
jgi:5-methylthioadenosine/S-adenosylhomocysteine deaminase